MSTAKLESLRKKAKNIYIIGIILSSIFGLFFGLSAESFFFCILGFVIGIIITIIIGIKLSKEFNKAFKDVFVLKSLQEIFTDLIYNPEKGLDESVIRNTQMMNMGDRYSSNDFISGKYKNFNVVQADVHIEEEHETIDSDGHTTITWVTLFRGRWMIFDFNKTFKTNIQVCQKGFGKAKLNNLFSKSKYKKVMMEDQKFNNNFKIYA